MTAAHHVDAKKTPHTAGNAMRLLRDVDELYATKGRAVVHVTLGQEKTSPEQLRSLVVGPTGNLRAPTLRVGRTLMVGFDEATYRIVLGIQE